jgi:hypothetical protein
LGLSVRATASVHLHPTSRNDLMRGSWGWFHDRFKRKQKADKFAAYRATNIQAIIEDPSTTQSSSEPVTARMPILLFRL